MCPHAAQLASTPFKRCERSDDGAALLLASQRGDWIHSRGARRRNQHRDRCHDEHQPRDDSRRFPNGAAAQPRRRTSTGPFMFGSTARGEDICVTAWAVTIRIAGVARSGDTPG
jgi:hypothetical protein